MRPGATGRHDVLGDFGARFADDSGIIEQLSIQQRPRSQYAIFGDLALSDVMDDTTKCNGRVSLGPLDLSRVLRRTSAALYRHLRARQFARARMARPRPPPWTAEAEVQRIDVRGSADRASSSSSPNGGADGALPGSRSVQTASRLPPQESLTNRSRGRRPSRVRCPVHERAHARRGAPSSAGVRARHGARWLGRAQRGGGVRGGGFPGKPSGRLGHGAAL